MVRVYIAGLLWEEKEREKLEEIDRLCKKLSMETYLPHRDAGIYQDGMDSKQIYEKDRDMVDWCDVMVAILDWKGIGSGTAWEMGYAYARGKNIIGLVEDKSSTKKEFRTCLMCFNSAIIVETLEELEKELFIFAKGRTSKNRN